MNKNLVYLVGGALVAYALYRMWATPKTPLALAPRPSTTVMPTPAPLAVDIPAANYGNTWTANGPLDLSSYDKPIFD